MTDGSLVTLAQWFPSASGERLFPLPLLVAHTAFLCVLIPVYWRYHGPANFLWFSDIAIFGAQIALWFENPLLASMQAVSVLLFELVWTVDFLARLISGVHLTKISRYMFDPKLPLFVRGLSLFHVWLPPLLLWMVYRLGYDHRAWMAQTVLGCLVLLLCYLGTNRAKNVNWAFGPWGTPQSRISPRWYLALLMLAFSIGVYLPTHLLLMAIMPARSEI
jgi:hypothetical protein